MSGAGNYGYGSNSGSSASSPEEEQRLKQISDEMEKGKVSPLRRKKNKSPKKDKRPEKDESPIREKQKIMDIFGWERSETKRQTIAVIGVDASTETEFAFQCKLSVLQMYLCYKYNTPFYR